MTDLLTDLLNAGLIDKLDGNDDRFTKMEKATEAVAQELRDQPPLLIRAILAALDPDIPADDLALVQAEQALINEWKSMRSVHTDRPVNLLRAILLAACKLAAEDGDNAAILWLTATDMLPMLRLGKEENVVSQILKGWATYSEGNAVIDSAISAENSLQEIFDKLTSIEFTTFSSQELDQDSLHEQIESAAGSRNQYGTVNFDNFIATQNLTANELVRLSSTFSKSQIETSEQVQEYLAELTEILKATSTSQQERILKTAQTEQTRLNALWWSEALYSPSLTRSYRELPQTIATVVMAIDLLNEVSKPTPASVGYLLAEVVNRLPEAGFDRKLTLQDLLVALAKDRT